MTPADSLYGFEVISSTISIEETTVSNIEADKKQS
jgi:hypothetical protein